MIMLIRPPVRSQVQQIARKKFINKNVAENSKIQPASSHSSRAKTLGVMDVQYERRVPSANRKADRGGFPRVY